MKRFITSTAFCLFVILIANAQSPTAPALNFNVFLENGASLTSNETEGPVAMGGNLTLSGSYQVSTQSVGTYSVQNVPVSLVIGGRIVYGNGQRVQVNSNGYVKIGDSTASYVWYKDQNGASSPIRITQGMNYNASPRIELSANAPTLGNVSAINNPVFSATSVNFTQAFTQMRLSSSSMSMLANNANLTDPNGNPIPNNNLPQQVKINLNNGVNVLNIRGSDLNNCQQFTYNQQPNANRVLIINVNAPGTFNWTTWNQGGFGGLANCAFILYNFYNTSTLNMVQGNAVEGTLFAPFADIVKTGNQSNIQGQVIAKSFIHNGGEVHYSVFNTPIIPTVSSFCVNDEIQCLSSNQFEFTGTSTGGGNLTYSWDFGDSTYSSLKNPTKVYLAPGNYLVKLITSGNLGSHTAYKTVTVNQDVSGEFTVNDSTQLLTGNLFKFKSIASGNYTYSWDFGDTQFDIGANDSIAHTYNSAGLYYVTLTVINGACRGAFSTIVLVASDSVGSGNGGGLESESLGELINKREISKAKNNYNRYIVYENLPIFKVSSSSLNKKSELNLRSLIPQNLQTGFVARETTPTDLVDLTIAKDVLSVDYTQNNRAQAVVLGIKTIDRSYNHTKSICDRLHGATIIDIKPVSIKGYEFIQFALKQANGNVEYAISFAIAKQNNQNEFSLYSNWLLSSIPQKDLFFNMQVWANQPAFTHELVSKIIANVQSLGALYQQSNIILPQVYVLKGERVQENLSLEIVNKSNATSAVLKFEQRLNENDDYTYFNYPITLNPNGVTTINIPVKDGFEYDLAITVNDKITDETYLADAGWSLDYDRTYTTINEFLIKNEPSRQYAKNEFSIYRSVNLKATTDDYVNLYKPIKPGATPVDLSTYNSIQFEAKGKGKLNVQLNKASITNWYDQYTYSFNLSEQEQTVSIPFSHFKSIKNNEQLNASDLTMMVFTFAYQENNPTFELEISDVKFVKTSTGISNEVKNFTPVSIYPNPSNGKFDIMFSSSQSDIVNIQVTDILGRIIYSKKANVLTGSNFIKIDLLDEYKGAMFINITGNYQGYATQKVIIK
ncbi:MAG: CIA30 family protein [Bacteroidia bacterium]|nr:CIA30 family protein [Bacteroidia bacterium]